MLPTFVKLFVVQKLAIGTEVIGWSYLFEFHLTSIIYEIHPRWLKAQYFFAIVLTCLVNLCLVLKWYSLEFRIIAKDPLKYILNPQCNKSHKGFCPERVTTSQLQIYWLNDCKQVMKSNLGELSLNKKYSDIWFIIWCHIESNFTGLRWQPWWPVNFWYHFAMNFVKIYKSG